MKFCSILVDRWALLPIVLVVMVFNAPACRTVEAAAGDDGDGRWQAGNSSEMSGLKVTLSKPVLVARSKRYLWFPTVVRLTNGELAAMMSDYADEHVAQGTSHVAWSADGGLTWSPPSKALAGAGTLILPNGDLLWMPYYLRPLENGGMGAPYQLCPQGQRALRAVQPGVTIEGWPRPDKSFAPQLGISGLASAPLLQKNTLSAKEWVTSSSAILDWGSL